MALSTGSQIGSYRVVAPLGSGGMGEVYRAHDWKLGREVAIKILPAAFAADPDRLARVEREARLLASLNHPNIAAIYGIENGALILELVDGPTLAERLTAGSREPGSQGPGLRMSDALAIARQIADALDAAHEKGIIHRDLKPANIKLTKDGVVKVLDFGLATAVAPADSIGRDAATLKVASQDGMIVGTPAYMSPEQARGLPVDKRTDIWAFGCVLYEMLARAPTFEGRTAPDVMANVLHTDPNWTALPASTPPPVRQLIERCLDRDPKQRLRDIGDARLFLDAAPAGAATPQRSRAWMWLGAAVLAGAAAATLVWMARRPPTAPANPLADAQFTRLTDFEGSETDGAISRDGNYVAFRSDRDGPVDTWVSRIGSGRFTNLTGGTQNTVLVRNEGFAPDGSEIWLSSIQGGAQLRLIPVTGGGARSFLIDHAMNPVWSPDGARIAFHTYDPGDPMFVSDASGASVQQILSVGAGRHSHYPQWSVDGVWIYFSSGFWDARQMDIWRIKPSGGAPERLTQLNTDIRYVAPLDRRTILYIAPDQNGTGPWLWALDAERRTTQRINAGSESYLSVDVAAGGRRLVATVAKPTADLWTLPLVDRLTDDRDVQPLRVPSVRAFAPRFGGSALFYLSSSRGGDGLWRYESNQTTEIWRGADGALLEPAAVSSDGRRAAVILRKDGRRMLHTLSADGGDVRPLAPELDVSSAVAWAPDGQWIAAAGSDGKQPGLFKVPSAGGAIVRLANGLVTNPAWSSDGTVIAYTGPVVGPTGPLLMMRPDGTAVPGPPIRVRAGGEYYRFVPGRSELVYLLGVTEENQGADIHFWSLNLKSMTSRQLSKSDNRRTRTFDISPDGKQIIFDRLRDNADIVLIDLPNEVRK